MYVCLCPFIWNDGVDDVCVHFLTSTPWSFDRTSFSYSYTINVTRIHTYKRILFLILRGVGHVPTAQIHKMFVFIQNNVRLRRDNFNFLLKNWKDIFDSISDCVLGICEICTETYPCTHIQMNAQNSRSLYTCCSFIIKLLYFCLVKKKLNPHSAHSTHTFTQTLCCLY